ncbi:hypothetical protein AC599_21275, partial [Yersinia pestis subsp. microtus bv. Altaica]
MTLTTLLAGWVFQTHAETLTVVSFGGLNKDAQVKAFYKPFTHNRHKLTTVNTNIDVFQCRNLTKALIQMSGFNNGISQMF